MIKVFLFMLVLLRMTQCYSQEPIFQWVKTFESLHNVNIIDIEQDTTGDLVVIGNYASILEIDPENYNAVVGDSAYYGNKGVVAKFTRNGNLKWYKSFESTTGFSTSSSLRMSPSLRIASDGSVILCGTFFGNCDFNPNEETEYIVPSGQSYAAFILKLSSEGELIWVKTITLDVSFAATFTNISAEALELDLNDNVYLSGAYRGGADFDPDAVDMSNSNTEYPHFSDGYIVKLSNDGDFRWKKTFGGYENDWISMVKRGLNNDLYLSIIYHDSIQLSVGGQNVLLNHPIGFWPDDKDVVLAKMDTLGQIEWITQVVGGGPQEITDLEVDTNGEIYVCGYFTGSITMNPFILGSYSFSNNIPENQSFQYSDGFLFKYSENGDAIWGTLVSSIDTDQPRTLKLHENYIYIGGVMGDSLSVGFDLVGVTQSPGTYIYDEKYGALLKTTKDGIGQSVQRFESYADTEISDFLIDGNNIFSVGSYNGLPDFDPSVSGIYYGNLADFKYGFLHKMIFTTDTLNYPDFSIFPNPTNSSVNLFVQAFENTEVVIFDIQGRLIDGFRLESKLTTVDLSEEASGVYLFVMQNGEKREVLRVVKEW